MKRLFTALIGVGLIASLYGYDKSGYYPDPLSLTGNGTISGSWTVGGNIIGSSNIFVSQRAKIGLDGASGNSYIMSDTGDIMKFYTGGAKSFEIGTSSINTTVALNVLGNLEVVSGDLIAGGQIINAGGLTLNTNDDIDMGNQTMAFGYSSQNNMARLVTGTDVRTTSNVVWEANGSSMTVNQPLYCNQTITMSAAKNVLLTGDSYIGLLGANPITSPKLVFADGNTDLRGGGGGTTSSLNMWVNGAEVLEVAASSVTVKQPLYIDSGLIANTYLRLKTFSTAELMGINPDVVGKLYYNSSTNKVCVSTGTTMGAFGSIAVGDYFK
jgi:hypothetical protein